MSDAFGALSSRLRLFADAMHDAFIRLEGGEDITDLVQEKMQQCGTMLETSPETSKLAAVESRAINSFVTILREVLTVLEGPKGRINALRRRLGPGRNANAYVDDCKPRIGEWRKRVEDAIHLRDVEARVILQDMGFAIGGSFPTRGRSATLPPRGAAQDPVPETAPGLTVDAVLALHERLLGHVVRNHEQVLSVAGISEREREHMQRTTLCLDSMEAKIATIGARQKRTNIILVTAFFFFKQHDISAATLRQSKTCHFGTASSIDVADARSRA